MGDGGFRPAYNVELATDLDSLVIVGADVINAGSDSGQMEPMVQRIESEQEPLSEDTEYYVDGSFATQDDIQSVGQRGMTVFAPVKEAARQQQAGKNPYARRRGDKEHVGAPGVSAWVRPKRKRNISSGVKRNSRMRRVEIGACISSWCVVLRK